LLTKGIGDAKTPVDDEAVVHILRPEDAAIGAKRSGNHQRVKDRASITFGNPQRLRVRVDVDGQDGFAESAER
jgi:hypothetical protein